MMMMIESYCGTFKSLTKQRLSFFLHIKEHIGFFCGFIKKRIKKMKTHKDEKCADNLHVFLIIW